MLEKAVEMIKQSNYLSAFTGAGISTESGIPPFRGPNGLWSKYNPRYFDIEYFHSHPEKSWEMIKKIFFDTFIGKKPNPAHYTLSKLEDMGLLKVVITQNIDNLHQKAGSKNVVEYHGNSSYLVCESCTRKYPVGEFDISIVPPTCPSCKSILKPDFVFFGEGIPEKAVTASRNVERLSDVMLVIGTSGEIYPASLIPINAKENGCRIIEINLQPTKYTNSITDIFLQGKASDILKKILRLLEKYQ